VYFLPTTSNTVEISQCLSYFFNAFSKSKQANQEMISKVFFKAFLGLEAMTAELEESVTLAKSIGQLLEWTDERNLREKPEELLYLHVRIAEEGMELAISESTLFCKSICQMLSKIYLPSVSTAEVKKMKQAAVQLSGIRLDLVCSRALEKFTARLDGYSL